MIPCSKRVFWTRRAANVHKKKASRAYGKRLRAYRCPACGLWHLTSREPRVDRRELFA